MNAKKTEKNNIIDNILIISASNSKEGPVGKGKNKPLGLYKQFLIVNYTLWIILGWY